MKMHRLNLPTTLACVFAITVCSLGTNTYGGDTPSVGDALPSVKLPVVAGSKKAELDLATIGAEGKGVVIFLRGFPGYQCPLCSRQVAGWMKRAKDFKAAETPVVFVYPGPDNQLDKRADEFLQGTRLPAPMVLVLDPGYEATNALNIRWNAPKETAYPSTFVIENGKVSKAEISTDHAGRTDPSFALN